MKTVRLCPSFAKLVSDDVDWPHNDNRVYGKRYGRMNGRHQDHY